MAGENDYLKALREARALARRNATVTTDQIQALFLDTSEHLQKLSEGGTNALTRERASQLRSQILEMMGDLETRVARGSARALEMTVDDVSKMHLGVLESLSDQAPRGAQITSRLGALNTDAMTMALLGQSNPTATFKTLMRRNMLPAVPVIDTAINRALLTGTSARQLTERLARVLVGDETLLAQADGTLRKMSLDQLRQLGIGPGTHSGLKTLYYDSRRIAVSSINNGLRETNALALSRSPVVAGAEWWLSGRHQEEDACDILATQDLYGMGGGVYPAEYWPVAPHPFCACYQGRVIARPPEQWGTEYDPPPRIRSPADNPAWSRLSKTYTHNRILRMQAQVLDSVETAEDRFLAIAAPRPETIEAIKQVLRLTDEGKTPKEIAVLMGISDKRVRQLRRQGEREGIKYDGTTLPPIADVDSGPSTVRVDVPVPPRHPGKKHFMADQKFKDDVRQWLLLKDEDTPIGGIKVERNMTRDLEIFADSLPDEWLKYHLNEADLQDALKWALEDDEGWIDEILTMTEDHRSWVEKYIAGQPIDIPGELHRVKELQQWLTSEMSKRHRDQGWSWMGITSSSPVPERLIRRMYEATVTEKQQLQRLMKAANVRATSVSARARTGVAAANMEKLLSVSPEVDLEEKIRTRDSSVKARFNTGFIAFRQLVHQKYSGRMKPIHVKKTKDKRAFHSDSDWDDRNGFHSSVNLNPYYSDEGTVVHEIAHHLEEEIKEIREAAQDFYFTRTHGEALQLLSDVTGNPRYKAYEKTRPDGFFSPYIGKVYGERPIAGQPTFKASEIISMGLEAMYRDPLKFLDQDPEHFALIWAIVIGEI